MSSGQQIIKVLAIIFAIFLIVNIFGWALFGISTFLGFMQIEENSRKDIEFSEVYKNNVETIKISTAISKLTIKEGPQLKVEGTNLPNKFSSKIVGTTLNIKEEGSKRLISNNITSELTITIPSDTNLNKLEIDAGVGNNEIQNITVNNFDLDCGVGTMQIENLNVLSKTKIVGGTGKTVIKNSELQKLDLDAGVGEMNVSAKIEGSSKIECGVGRLELNLLNPEEKYTITTNTGLGRMTINGKKCNDSQKYGSGENSIKVNGGVGAVEITTLKSEVL